MYVSVIMRWVGQEFRGAYSKCTAGGTGIPQSGTVYLDSPIGPLSPEDYVTEVVTIPVHNVNMLSFNPVTPTIPVTCTLVSSAEFELWDRPAPGGSGAGGGGT
jgi:hypothetical protein